ncbi:MAG: sigma-70 family RNA polymerase sigma factor [Pseudonocardiaceae bacterium]
MCAQDPSGLAAAYDTYAERLHAYAWSILRDHDAAADAVHDSFLIAGQRISGLRDPERLRPWLYAIVRHECLRQLRTRGRNVELTEAEQVRDESVDLDAGLRTEQHRELIWTAAAGVSPKDREVLELSVRHGLEGAELAAALGVSTNHAHALLSRARQNLERALTVVVVSRTGRRDCADLDGLLIGWDGELTPLWRKRIARHIEKCEACGGTKRREVRAVALLATVPFVALPIALRDRVLSSADLKLVDFHTTLAARAGQFDGKGFPKSATAARTVGLAAPPQRNVYGVGAALFLGGLLLLFLHDPIGDLFAGSSVSRTVPDALPVPSPRTPSQLAPQIINPPLGPASGPSGSPVLPVVVPHAIDVPQQQVPPQLPVVPPATPLVPPGNPLVPPPGNPLVPPPENQVVPPPENQQLPPGNSLVPPGDGGSGHHPPTHLPPPHHPPHHPPPHHPPPSSPPPGLSEAGGTPAPCCTSASVPNRNGRGPKRPPTHGGNGIPGRPGGDRGSGRQGGNGGGRGSSGSSGSLHL